MQTVPARPLVFRDQILWERKFMFQKVKRKYATAFKKYVIVINEKGGEYWNTSQKVYKFRT